MQIFKVGISENKRPLCNKIHEYYVFQACTKYYVFKHVLSFIYFKRVYIKYYVTKYIIHVLFFESDMFGNLESLPLSLNSAA